MTAADATTTTAELTSTSVATEAATTIPPTTNSAQQQLEELPSEEQQQTSTDPSPPPSQYDYYTDEDLPPLRINVLARVAERLSASTPNLQVPPAVAAIPPSGGSATSSPMVTPAGRRKKVVSSVRSRSRSPSITGARSAKGGGAQGATSIASTTEPGDSSVSSIEDLDSDILTDRMGLEELDLEKQRSSSDMGHVSVSSLPPVTERLSEDTLEDAHAFSDFISKGTASRGTSIATRDEILSLAVLDEIEEEEADDEVAEMVGVGGVGVDALSFGVAAIHISNMENLTIKEEQEEDHNSEGALGDLEDDNGTVPTTRTG